jgi:hypothetical protein
LRVREFNTENSADDQGGNLDPYDLPDPGSHSMVR